MFQFQLARELGYRSRAAMLEDLTFEEWFDWLTAFIQNPWDEQRKDDRNAVNALWSIAPYMGDSDLDLPGFNGPAYKSEEVDIEASMKRLNELKKKILDGKLNSKTSDPANG